MGLIDWFIHEYLLLFLFFVFFSFIWLINFQKKNLLYDISVFSHMFHGFFKNCIIHQLIKIFFKIFFFLLFFLAVFISINGFNQAFWLNLMILCTFSNTNPRFDACFKFLMCITYSSLPCKFATSFSTLSVFIISSKNGKSS